MKLAAPGEPHLCYGTNVHAGESWPEVLENVKSHVVAVKKLVCPNSPFACGLRLSAAAAKALAVPEELSAFKEFLRSEGLYVFTLNGFPYGAFHRERVKEAVYRPDWLEESRLVYTNQLAAILSELLPPQLEGTVSTVPVAFAPRVPTEAEASRAARQLLAHAAALVHIHRETGRCIALALEPEPCCHLETVSQTVAFFNRYLYSRDGLSQLQALTGLSLARAAEAARRHLGVCFDACHMAVEFENPAQAIAAFRGAGIRIAKVQISSGLKLLPAGASREALRGFADEVYLHQVVENSPRGLTRFLDLPEALGARLDDAAPSEWRVHFHVPVHRSHMGALETTQAYLRELLSLLRTDAPCPHLEVETYTWDVIPKAHRPDEIHASLAKEMLWVAEEMSQ